MRDAGQRFWDIFSVLSLFEAVNRISQIDGNLKVQKLVFLAELNGQAVGLRNGHYRFFSYQYGPYSTHLAQDVGTLETLGFIAKTSRQLRQRGRFLLEYLDDYIKRSGEAIQALEIINQVVGEYGKLRGPKITDVVYRMQVPVHDLGGELERVRKIPLGLNILDPVNTKLVDVRPFDEEILKDLEEEFSIPAEDLQPTSRSFRETVGKAVARITEARESN